MKKSHLSLEQRYQIQAYLEAGKNQSEIARIIGKCRSVVSRELLRNRKPSGQYHGGYAAGLADIRKERLKRPRKLDGPMEVLIRKRLTEDDWSPEQIKGHADRKGIPMVSHERIYALIRADKAAGGTLYKHTRHQLKHRKRPVGGKQVVIKNKRSIEDRPAIVETRERVGDWEVDTIIGPQNKGALLTIVERKTGILFMEKLTKGKQAAGVAQALCSLMVHYKENVHTITADNGSEFAAHETIAHRLEADFFFAHPYSSWERGLNEYTNKLIRQYIPKKQLLENISTEEIKKIQHKINARPRKKLQYQTPKDVFYAYAG